MLSLKHSSPGLKRMTVDSLGVDTITTMECVSLAVFLNLPLSHD